jgi:anti-sigma B factor antagonist
MNITEEPIDDQIIKINLSGRMDIEGVGHIETQFAGMTASPRSAVIVDMSEVPYMSSIGIRALLMNAKSVAKRGGKLVLLSPQANVRNVLVTSGIDQIIKIHSDLDEAVAYVTP